MEKAKILAVAKQTENKERKTPQGTSETIIVRALCIGWQNPKFDGFLPDGNAFRGEDGLNSYVTTKVPVALLGNYLPKPDDVVEIVTTTPSFVDSEAAIFGNSNGGYFAYQQRNADSGQ